MRPLTYYFQKTMIPVGSLQKPLLEYVVRLLRYHNVRDIVMLVDYKAEQIINYFGDGSRFNVRVRYIKDDPKYAGNAGALFSAYLKGALEGAKTVLIYYGDILSNIDLTELLKMHEERKAAATLALSPNYAVSVGVARVVNGRVVELVEKPPLGKPVAIGVLALDYSKIPLIEGILREKGSADIMGDLIPLLIRRGEEVCAFLTDAFWYDVGSTEKYEKLDNRLVDEILSYLLKD